MIFKDRTEAGRLLGEKIKELIQSGRIVDPVVVALPRGGVPVAAEIAKEINAPLDILFVKKIPSPVNEEAAIGSVSESGLVFVNTNAIETLKARGIDVDESYIQQKALEKIQEMARKRDTYKVEPLPLEGKDVILVDDGIATGASMYLAAQSVVRDMPRSITIAAPVAPADENVLEMLRKVSHNLVILETPPMFMSVGQWYEDFHQLSDKEVKEILSQFR
ncbi:phosphoribosyltransferase [Caminibacter pacificus]|uniref:Phosphoribosyltransferase n=1 Tax=Caminibacter pacificus TaxID=1424653 RepID=A0AAJ4REC9_9BACT|nr:phosphoribosyltransferase family protein [Caminibacter pacificus]NPA88133.1 phosphoribosyltransferase [Campylobacterota bacterium]QCI28114.1 phosphoribosyltransferase [Caminibacter pacificus]ROR41175.1 putative phosphoribosyltransferase [Caminibacter pacificus]